MKLVRPIKICLNKTYDKVRIGTHLSDHFSIQNDLKQGDDLTLLLFNFASKYSIMEVQGNQLGLKLKRTRQLPVCADNVNLVEDNIYTIKKTIKTLIGARKETGLQVNAEKCKYMLLSSHNIARKIMT
jgi:hypothetical protein